MLVIAVAFIVAGIAKGAIGMGLPPIALGRHELRRAARERASPSWSCRRMATNIWQAIYGGDFVRLLRRFGAMAAAAVVG